MTRRTRVLVALLFTLSLLPASAAAEPTQIKIGGIFDLTSAAGSVWGNDERDGFIAAIEDFRAANPGYRVEYKIEDSAYSNNTSVSALQKLTSVDRISFIVGPTWETFVATAPICESKHVICLAPSNYGPIFHDPNRPLRYSFTAFFDERGYGTTLADRMHADQRSKPAVFSAISAYYETVSGAFLSSFGTPPASFQRFDTDLRDFKSLISRTPRDIDSLLLIMDGDGQNFVFLSQWAATRGDRPPLYSHDGILYEPRWEEIKKMGFPLQISKPKMDPELEHAWNEKFKARFGRAPGSPSGQISYDETTILLRCIKSRGASPDAVRECIAATNGYRGLSGTLSFGGGQTITTREYTVERHP